VNHWSLSAIVAPFLAGIALTGMGIGIGYLLRARYDNAQIAEERGAAGLLLTLTIGSLILALIAFGIGIYVAIVYWLLPH
jgi:hypothetical protein